MNVVNFPILKVKNLHKRYDVRKFLRTIGTVKALSGVTFSLAKGETLAIVGESGCGKSTLAKLLMRIEHPSEGVIRIGGKDATALKRKESLQWIQMIFQDPYGSLNPRKKAWDIISEPLRINTKLSHQECRYRAERMMVKVGLRPEYGNRYPHMFSGGQRQRLGIARALIMEPKILVCDEPVSALDVSIQAQILNLLMDLQDELDLSYIFISHDLSVVRHIADTVMVIYLGKVVEYGSRQAIFSEARHPYTKTLLESTPQIPPRARESLRSLPGELPSAMNPPTGCAFHKRCPLAEARCRHEEPILRKSLDRRIACHLVD